MKRRLMITIMAMVMTLSLGCGSASAFTPNLSTKTNQWQTAKPVSSEYDTVGRKLVFTESQMKTKFANDFKKKAEEVTILDVNKIQERYEMTPGITVTKSGGKQVKVNKSEIMKHDIVKLGENYYYNFKEVTVEGKKLISATVLPITAGTGQDAKYESARPTTYQISKDGYAQFQNPINHKVDDIVPVISECWLVAGTEYKIYLPTTNAILRNVVDFRFSRANPGEHVASMQIID